MSPFKKLGKYKNAVDFKRMWDKIVIRVHCIPDNPRTIKQQTNRFAWRFVSRVGVGALVDVIRPYWNVLDVFGIGFNRFKSVNAFQVSQELEFDNLLMTFGIYEPVDSIQFIKYKDVNGRAMFKWSTVITGQGSPDDRILLILLDWSKYDPTKKIFIVDCYTNFDKIRSDSVGFILPAKDLDVTFLVGYISVISSLPVSENKMSISKYRKVISF